MSSKSGCGSFSSTRTSSSQTTQLLLSVQQQQRILLLCVGKPPFDSVGLCVFVRACCSGTTLVECWSIAQSTRRRRAHRSALCVGGLLHNNPNPNNNNNNNRVKLHQQPPACSRHTFATRAPIEYAREACRGSAAATGAWGRGYNGGSSHETEALDHDGSRWFISIATISIIFFCG